MANEQEIKDVAKKTGMTEEYVKSMLEFKENYKKQKEEVTPMAEALGMTPEQYISEIDRQESNLYFLTTKFTLYGNVHNIRMSCLVFQEPLRYSLVFNHLDKSTFTIIF